MKSSLKQVLDSGLVPYVGTSASVLPHLDLSVFEGRAIVKMPEEKGHFSFHQAYLLSNSLGFGAPDLKMPNWVYLDCVLLQTAVVGFAMPVELAPESLRTLYEADPLIDMNALDIIPISGQISAMGLDGKTLTGFSLFSLKSRLLNERKELAGLSLGTLTKFAALCAYKADLPGRIVRGVAQYDNPALKIHGLFSDKMYIEQPMLPLHPLKSMSFIYRMQVTLSEEKLQSNVQPNDREPDILLHAENEAMKQDMSERIKQGEHFYIQHPIQIKKDNNVYLPICVEK